MRIEPKAQDAWERLSQWQRSEVMRRFDKYANSPMNTPPKAVAFAPIDERETPDDVKFILTPADAPPNLPPLRKARFELRKTIRGDLLYVLAGIE